MLVSRALFLALLGASAALSAACAGAPAPSAEPAPTVVAAPPEPAPASTPTPAVEPAAEATPAWEGTWASASCGSRRYERLLTLGADGSFTAEDRVSPCPPKVQCIWSGIVTRTGSWRADGAKLTLTPAPQATGAGEPLPTTLVWDARAGAPAELGGGAPCTYASRR